MAAPLKHENETLLQSLQSHWDSTIIVKINSTSQMESKCTDTCDLSMRECPILQRLIFVTQFHSSWINFHVVRSSSDFEITKENEAYLAISLSAFISDLTHYSITQLIDDWHHLRNCHWNNLKQQYETRQYFQSVVENNCKDIDDCTVFARVNRDREQTKNREIRKRMYFIEGSDEYHSLEVITQQLCDCIHDWIFHSPIIPLLTKAASQQMLNDEDTKTDANNTTEIDSDEDWDFDASDVQLLRSLKSNKKKTKNTNEARKKAIGKLQNGDKYFQHSKFVTNTTEFEENKQKKLNTKFNTIIDGEEKTTDDKTTMTNSVLASPSYEFGIEMMYSERYQQYARHKSIREEVLNNPNKKYTLTMDQWKDTVTKAKQYVNCATGKRIKATVANDDLNIKMDDALTQDALIAGLLYTNFTDLQRRFSSSTRRYSHQQNKTDKDIRIEHYREYFYWGQALMVAIQCYGQKMNEKMSFYHGINTELVFANFIAYFNCPTSTTAQLSVASLFASDRGIILRLCGKIKGGGKTKFMNVSWFSDYPNEDERLLYGYHNQLEILSIYGSSLNYIAFIRALKVFDILTDPNTGAALSNKYAHLGDSHKRRKYCDYLLSMTKKAVDIEQYNQDIEQQKQNKKLKRKKWTTKEVPQYMMNMFNYFVIRQTAIEFDLYRLQELNHPLEKYFVIHQKSVGKMDGNDYCFNFKILLKLFPNATTFTLDFGYEALETTHFEFLCQCVSNAVNTAPINIVEFKGIEPKEGVKTLVKKMKAKYFSNGLYSIKLRGFFKSVQFVKKTKNEVPHYEDLFIGNLYQVNKDKRSWTMFVSTSKDKLIVPKSIQQVTFYLDKNMYNKAEIIVDKPPFSLKRKERGVFEVRVKICFRGKRHRYATWYYHTLNFDHPVSVSNFVCQSDCLESGCNHGKRYVLHSDKMRQYDFWACRRTDGGVGV
eukprot:783298_1